MLRYHCAFEDICFFYNTALLYSGEHGSPTQLYEAVSSGKSCLHHCHSSAGPSERHWGPHTRLLGTEGVINAKGGIFSALELEMYL